MQRYLFELLYENEKPMTLAAIRHAAGRRFCLSVRRRAIIAP
jgi:hypothetical protein